MKYLVASSRILLGLLFTIFGLNGFLHFIPAPLPTGLAGQFITAIFISRFYTVIFFVQLLGGLLLLANRFVPLALAILGPVLVNIVSFHIFLLLAGLPLALFTTALWFVVFYSVRTAFSGIFVSRVTSSVRTA